MADHEMPQTASEADFREEAHRRTLEDNAGFTVHRADVALTGQDEDRALYPRPRQRVHRVSYRGGRSFPQASESELDPDWNAPSEPLTDVEIARNHAWVSAIKLSLEERQKSRQRQ